MNVTQAHLKGEPKQIGHMDGMPVMEFETKGGLFLLMTIKKNGKTETLGAGPHKAIARHIAEKEHPSLRITQLEKSESLTKAEIDHHLPSALALTKQLRSME